MCFVAISLKKMNASKAVNTETHGSSPSGSRGLSHSLSEIKVPPHWVVKLLAASSVWGDLDRFL